MSSPFYALWVGLLLGLGTCPQGGASSSPQPGSPSAIRANKTGLPITGDFQGGPTVGQLFAEAAWHPMVWDLHADRGDLSVARAVSLRWLSLQFNDAGRSGRQLIKLRHAAFRRTHPPADAIGTIDEDVLDDLDIDPGPSHLVLVGRQACIAVAGRLLVLTRDGRARTLEILRELVGCGEDEWAPLAFVPQRLPMGLSWAWAQCQAEPDAFVGQALQAVGARLPNGASVGVLGRWNHGEATAAVALVSDKRWWVVPFEDDGTAMPPVEVADPGAKAGVAPCAPVTGSAGSDAVETDVEGTADVDGTEDVDASADVDATAR